MYLPQRAVTIYAGKCASHTQERAQQVWASDMEVDVNTSFQREVSSSVSQEC